MIKRHRWIQFGRLIVGILIGVLILYGIGRTFPLVTHDHHQMIFRMISKGIVYLALLIAASSALMSLLASQQLIYPKRKLVYCIGCGLVVCYATIGLLVLNHGMKEALAFFPYTRWSILTYLV